MKRITIISLALAVLLPGCALKGFWNLRGYEQEICRDKRLSKCRTTLKIPGKVAGCYISVGGYIWFSGNKRGHFVRDITTRVKCRGKDPKIRRTVLKGRFKVVKQHGVTYLVVQHELGSQKLILEKSLNRLYVIDVKPMLDSFFKDGKVTHKNFFIVGKVKYNK